MDLFEYAAELRGLGFSDMLVDVARELPGCSVSPETVVCLLRYAILEKHLPKAEALFRLAKCVALLDVRGNAYLTETDVEEAFDRLFKLLELDQGSSSTAM